MTTTIDAAIGLLDSKLLPDIRAHADALDRDEDTSRRSFAALGAAGLLGLGAPTNVDGRLPQMAGVISLISAECMSTGFSLWAQPNASLPMSVIGLPLLLNLFHPTAPRGGVSWGFGDDGLLTNIGITTVGNLIGGTLFVALPFWIIAQLQRRRV